MTITVGVALLLLACSGLGLGFWLAVLARVEQLRRRQLTIRAGLALPDPGPPGPAVSIIVPVHNEERVIDACASSLRRQRYEPIQIVFVLDRCTDGTRTVLRRHAEADPRIELVVNDECPPDWTGKCHAASRGASHADGDMLLFTDADTSFDPDLVRAAVAVVRDRDLALLSLLSTLTTKHAFEHVVQPVASINLVRMYPLARVRSGGEARPFANGQFLLFDRSWYERVGGHASVKSDLLEDLAFARHVQEAGGRCATLFADGMLLCSMYDSYEAFRTGWKRIFIEACRRKPRRLHKNGLQVLAQGVVLPALQLTTLGLGLGLALRGGPWLGSAMVAVAVAGWAVQLAALLRAYALSGAAPAAALLYPLGSWVVSRIMLEGARDLTRRRAIPWAGRQYVLEPRY